MKVVILAGGLGTRLAEETVIKPKPMVDIGGKPILWHIMNIYSAAGFREFYIALGYKGHLIKEYFLNYYAINNDFTIDLSTGETQIHSRQIQDQWRVTLVDTGENTQTGGRVRRLQQWMANEPFMMTYGDGVANVNLNALLEFHKSHGRIATVTAVHPPSRFGSLRIVGSKVADFLEKPQTELDWINGGFFVLNPSVFEYIAGDATLFEKEPMEALAREGQLVAFKHNGFWQPMDTLREKQLLEALWVSGSAPWKTWT